MDFERERKVRAIVPLPFGAMVYVVASVFLTDHDTRLIVMGIGTGISITGLVLAVPYIRSRFRGDA